MHFRLRNLSLFTRRQLPVLLAVVLILCAGVLAPLLSRKDASALTNGTINFQARLMNDSGSIAQDGFYNVEFKLYDALSSSGSSQGSCTGDSNCLWTETYYDTNGVTAGNDFRIRVVNGYMTVSLGSRTSFPSTIRWDQELWLTMNVGGTTQTATPTWDGEMDPRLKLTSVPYAFRAGTLGGGVGSDTTVLDAGTPSGAHLLHLPAEDGTLCVQSSVSCGFLTGAATDFIQNGTTVQTSANFNIRSNAIGSVTGVLQGANGQTADLFDVQTWNGTTATTVLAVSNVGLVTASAGLTVNGGAVQLNHNSNNNTSINTGTSTGTVGIGNSLAGALTFQSGSTIAITTTNFNVSTTGVVSLAGAQTRDITTPDASSATAITMQPGIATGVNGIGAVLGLKGGDASSTTCGTACTGGNVTVQGGSATGLSGTTRNGGSVTINGGSGASANGSVSIGTATTSGVFLGASGITTTNSGTLTVNETATIQGADALTLGVASTNTGAILFKGSGGSGTLTLRGPANPNTFVLSIPAITADANVCTDNAICSGYAAAAGSGFYLQQVPTSNVGGALGANIVSPTAASIVGLTVNATSSVGNQAIAAVFAQSQGSADAVHIDVTNSSGTVASGLAIAKTNGGTLTSGLSFSGTIGTDINRTSGILSLQGTGGVTVTAGGTTTLGLDTGGAGTVTLGNANATTINIGATSGSTTTIAGGNVGHTVDIAAAGTSSVQAVTIGSTGSTSSLTLQAGTGNLDIGNDSVSKTSTIRIGADATGADILALGSAHASSTVTIESGTVGTAIQIGNGNTAHGIQIGTGAAIQTVNLGSTNSTSATTIQGGTNAATAVSIQAASTGGISIGTTNANTVILGGASSTVRVGALAAVQTTSQAVCRDTATNNLTACDGGTGGKPFIQGGNTFGAIGVLGTNDSNGLQFETNNTVRATFGTSDILYLGNAASATGVATGAPTNFAVQGTGSGTVGTKGGNLTIQGGSGAASSTGSGGGDVNITGGNSAGSGANNGGDIYLYGGTKTSTGADGDIILAHNGTSAIGNVGIGMAAPTARLTVAGATVDSSTAVLKVTDSASTQLANFRSDGEISLGVNRVAGVLGHPTIGANTDTDNADFINGTMFTTSSAMSVVSLSVYIATADTGPTNDRFVVGVYTDNAGVPDTLVASSTIGHLVSNSWNTLAVSASLSSATNYWLMYTADGSAGAINSLNYDAVGTSRFKARTFDGTLPASFTSGGSGTGTNVTFSIYATASGGSSAVLIDPLGNVGIGTNAPNSTLDVYGTARFRPVTDNTTAFRVQNAAASSTIFNIDTANGRVGINTNTAAPTADLSFGVGVNRVINVLTQTTAATAGNNLTINSGQGNTSGAGGILLLQAGTGGTTGAGGATTVQGGSGGSTSGAGGLATIQGGNATAGNSAGGGVSVLGGTATGSGAASVITITAGNGVSGQNTAGGAVNITSGTGGGNQAGGVIALQAGTGGATGLGGAITLTGGTGGGATLGGGAVSLTGGTGNTSGTGGTTTVQGGRGGATGAGGAVTVQGGTGGTTSGAGGAVTVSGGTALGAFAAGDVTIQGGAAAATAGSNGGAVTVRGTAGTSTGTGGTGGGLTLQGGNAGGSGANAGGSVSITSGSSTSTGAASTVSITSGAGASGNNVQGGAITVTTGAGGGTQAGGTLTLQAGQGGATGAGGAVTVQAGAGGATSGAGGLVTVQGGNATAGASGGGGVSILGGTATTTGAASIITITSGNGVSGQNTAGGAVNITSGNGGGNQVGGTIALQAGTGGATGIGGAITLTGGTAGGATIAGGAITLRAGTGNTSGLGGALNLQGGTGGNAAVGGVVAIQGGNAGGGNANGANVTLAGGTGAGAGVQGLVVINTPTFTTASTQACGSNCNITQANIDGSGGILINATATGLTVTLSDPTITTAGRIMYVTNVSASNDFILAANAGVSTVTLKPNTSATMVWNGSDWTAAGASSSTDLQAAYNNTASSAGAAELVLKNTASSNGLTVRNGTAADEITGGLLEVQTAIGSNLFTVNNNATEYATNGGAETAGGTPTTFPATTWDTTTGGTIDRWVTAGDNIATGTASVRMQTTTTNHGARNRISASLTSGLTYTVSFAVRGATNFSTLQVLYSPDGTTTGTTQCATAQTVTSGIWTRISCSFIASGTITSSNSILIRQTDATARTFYVDNLSVNINASATFAADGSVDVALGSNWTAFGTLDALTRDTSIIYDTSGSVNVDTPNNTDRGVRNNLSILPATSTQYLVTFYARSSDTFNDIRVRYSRDGGTNFVTCVDYNTQIVSTTGFTKITCLFTTDGTTATNPDLIIDQPSASNRNFYIDALTITLNTNNSNNVQIGSGNKGGPTTLFTLDRASSAPIAANNDAYLGSLYYDTTSGRIQCYEADGWGACGAAPDNIVNLNPEYAGAVLNGTGIGTMTADFCVNQASISFQVNTGICSSVGESRNYYRWTSPQATEQTYSIYVSYQLPTTFNGFSSDDTIQLAGRVDATANASVTYQVYRSTGSAVSQCWNNITAETVVTSSDNTWQSVGINGNEATGCGFNSSAAGNFVIFKINVKAKNNANAYVSTLSFTTTGR